MDTSAKAPAPAPKSIKGTQTEKNLVTAYLSETQAYARYIFYAKQAKKENYFPIQNVFEETAANELHHAKIFFKFLEGGKVTATLENLDAGVTGTTAENLQISIGEEEFEGIEQYKAFAKVALEEGFPVIASHFLAIASIEEHHKTRFETWLKHVQDGTCWTRDHVIKWKCLVCGYIFEGKQPPLKCPACDHPREHYMALDI
ncbi:MAG: rubrerythrin family protein [Muribaculaceae bacterium]|nr:rubrerythrin family protein [Muribaculaceae bacterium]